MVSLFAWCPRQLSGAQHSHVLGVFLPFCCLSDASDSPLGCFLVDPSMVAAGAGDSGGLGIGVVCSACSTISIPCDDLAGYFCFCPCLWQVFPFLRRRGKMTQYPPSKALPLPPAAFLPFTLKAITGWSKWSRFAISFQSTYLIKVNELLI